MMKERPILKWKKTGMGEGEIFPVCPSCDKRYEDGQILDIKNYPDDGGGIIFLECQHCKTESEVYFEWIKILDVAYNTANTQG